MRDLAQPTGMDLGIDDAKIIVEELKIERSADYWSDRQLAWKARLCDVRRIEVECPSGFDPDTLLAFGDWTGRWPLICVDDEKELVKIGLDEPGRSVWIWVEYFRVDSTNLLSADEPFLVEEYGDLLVA